MIVTVLAAAYLALLLIKSVLAVRAARRAPSAAFADWADVAIAQPILSGDPGLSRTLEDNLKALPWAHFIWLIDADDPVAVGICSVLQQRYSETRIDILTLPAAAVAENPKVFKLSRARPLIRERILLVLDDDTRMPAATLSALVAALDRHELATALPAYVDGGEWPSRLLAAFVNNNAALTYLPLLNVAPAITINGMAYAIATATLDRFGGFEAVLGSVTDDLAVASRVRAIGGRIWQSASPVWVETTVSDGRQYLRQMHRWYVFAVILVAGQRPAMQMAIAGLNAMPSLLLWIVVFLAVWRPSFVGMAVLAATLVLRGVVIAVLQRHIYGRSIHRPLYSVASELLQPWHLVHALVQRTIAWRTRRYRVFLDQTFRAVR